MTFNAFRTPDLPLKKGSFLKKLPDRMEKMRVSKYFGGEASWGSVMGE